MDDKREQYENARMHLQDAVVLWLSVGADIDGVIDEVRITHEWYEDELSA